MIEMSKLRWGGVFAALILACLPVATSAQSGVPVMVGGEVDFDACGTIGKVRGLNPQGDGFLAVRAGPGTGHAMLDKVYNGDLLSMCDERGPWIGVVYSRDGIDCGVGTPWPRRQPYNGPCRAGWVHSKYVVGFAG